MKLSLVTALAGVAACAPRPLCSRQPFIDQSSYRVAPQYRTPHGVQVDPSGLRINPQRIDRLWDEVEACVARVKLSTEEAMAPTTGPLDDGTGP